MGRKKLKRHISRQLIFLYNTGECVVIFFLPPWFLFLDTGVLFIYNIGYWSSSLITSDQNLETFCKLVLDLTHQCLTRALLGLWIFHRLLGGGGAFERPPPWSRLLVAVEKNERQRSKAREKSFRNHLGHFLAQVKIGVSRGQNSKIFQNGFSTIKSFILKIEQGIWYHCVCLVKARRTIYKMTLKGQGQSLTSGQVRPRSRDDRNGSYCISLDSPGKDERTDTNPTSLSLFDQRLLANDGW